MNLSIIRDTVRADGVLGTLTIGSIVFQTLELPWVPIPDASCGKPDASCVPLGNYSLALHDTPEHPHTFALVAPSLDVFHEPADVPADCPIARTACLIHVANFPSELEGCIALGNQRDLGGATAIWYSADAMKAFAALVPWITGNTLTISLKI